MIRLSDSSKKHIQNLSELHEDIVYNIFSYMDLTSKELIELSLVSKQFSSILQKHPALVFDGSDSDPEMQLSYMISTLDRYLKHNIPLDKFTFKLENSESSSSTSTEYDRCIQLAAAQKGLRFLSLRMPGVSKNEGYSVPWSVFELDSLVELCLRRCHLKLPDRIAWRKLKQLTLTLVEMDEGVFLKIMKCCPLIEKLDITVCYGDFPLDYLSAATNLGKPLFYQNLKDLAVLLYPRVKTTSNELKLNFPRLEKLQICNCCSKTMNISSTSLKNIDYVFWDEFEGPHEAHFDAPNIVDFKFNWYWNDEGKGYKEIDFPEFSFAGNSSRWTSHLEMAMLTDGRSWWLLELERCLKKFSASLNSSEIASLTIDLMDNIVPRADEMTVHRERIPGIPDIYINSSRRRFCLSSARAILDGIFLICHPKRVTFGHYNYIGRISTQTEHNVKFPTSDQRDEFMEVLKDHEKEDVFSVVFNLEY